MPVRNITGIVTPVSYTRDSRFEYSNPFIKTLLFLSLNSLNSVKTFDNFK